MPLTVKILTPAHDLELTQFLDSINSRTPSVLGYYYPFYRRMLNELGVGDPLYLAARDNEKIVGILPVFRKKSPAGTVLNSLPFFGPNAGVLSSPDNHEQIHGCLLTAFINLSEREDAISSAVYTPFLFQDFHLYDKALPEAIRVEKFTQYLDLGPDIHWSSKIRYDLKKARAAGVTIRKEVNPEHVEKFYQIYQQNCEEYKIPLKPRKCIDLLLSPENLGRNSDIYFAFLGEKMIAGLLVLFSPGTVSYYIPCTLPEEKTLQPGTILIDEAVSDAKRKKIRFWNWESSPTRESGVYRFKKKWDSMESLYRVYVTPRRPESFFKSLGAETIKELFPFYFVFPFDLL